MLPLTAAGTGAGAAGDGVAVEHGLDGDTPSRPFGGGEEVAWSADGRTLFFALRVAGTTEPLSTNLDIYRVAADGSAAPVNLTEANRATDNLPAVSPDGRWLAWAAMKRPGYESDRMVLMLRDLSTGQTRALTEAGTAPSNRSTGAPIRGRCTSPPRTRRRTRCGRSTSPPASRSA